MNLFRQKHRNRDWALFLAIVLLGLVCMLLTGTLAIGLAPQWTVQASMDSKLDPNARYLALKSTVVIEPVLPAILTQPPWHDTFLTPQNNTPTPTRGANNPSVTPKPSGRPPVETSTFVATPQITATKHVTITSTPWIILPSLTPVVKTRTPTQRPPVATKTYTSTKLPTKTKTPTLTRTITPTKTASSTRSVTPSITTTPTRSATPTITTSPTRSATPTITTSPTRSATPTSTIAPTLTATFTVTGTLTKTLTPTFSMTPTVTRSPTMTFTPTITVTPSNTLTPSPTSPIVIPPGCGSSIAIGTAARNYVVPTGGACFRVVNPGYTYGGRVRITNRTGNAATIGWYGKQNSANTSCSALQTTSLPGYNTVQIAVYKSGNDLYFTVDTATTIRVSVKSWADRGCP